MSFLGTMRILEHNRTLSISVCRKPTHTDQYLQWNSHHHIASKYSVINKLVNRSRDVCFKPELLRT